MASDPDLVVYTVLTGGYESLVEQPLAHGSGVEWVCLTDRADLSSDTWEVRPIRPVLPMDAPRSSREPKIRPHLHFPEHDRSLYIDNAVQLLVDPRDVVAALMAAPDVGLGMCSHSFRDSLDDEFLAVLQAGLDDVARVNEQWTHYLCERPDILSLKPLWGGIIARRHRAVGVAEAMEAWWTQVLRHSRRDQLSLRYALATAAPDLRLNVTDVDNGTGDGRWRWPASDGRDRRRYTRSAGLGVVPVSRASAVHQVVHLEGELEAARQALATAEWQVAQERGVADERGEHARALGAALDEARGEIRRVEQERQATQRHLDELLASRSWRLTGPYRSARASVARLRHRDVEPPSTAQEPADPPSAADFETRMAEAYRARFPSPVPAGSPVPHSQRVWLKRALDRDPLLHQLVDKVDVRDYVARRVGPEILTTAFAVLHDVADLSPTRLPRQFVAKASHGSGGVALVWDGPTQVHEGTPPWWRATYNAADVDWPDLRRRMARCLARDYGDDYLEWAYLGLPRRVIVEEVLRGPDGDVPDDLKLFVFGGTVRFIGRFRSRFGRVEEQFFDRDWNDLGFSWGQSRPSRPFDRPETLEQMIEVSEELARGQDFMRVDLYDTRDGVRFGECTPYPLAGSKVARPDGADALIGSWWPDDVSAEPGHG